MSIIRELGVKLGLDVDAASFAEGQLAVEGVKLGLELVVEAAKKTIEFFVDVAKEAVETAGALNDTSQAIGVTTDALQELQYAGGLAGVSADEMTQAITILSKTMAHAAAGGEEQAKAFAKIGVKVKDATGHLRPAEDVIGDIADHFKTMPDGAEKTAQAVELFGRSGARMVSMLNDGGDGLAALRQEAHDLGLVMDADTIKMGDDVGDNIDRLKAIFTAIKVQAGAALFPVLKRITELAIDWIKANKELIKQKLAAVLLGIAKAAKVLIEAADVLWGSLKLIYSVVSSLVEGAFKVLVFTLNQVGVVGRTAALAFAAAWIIATAPIVAIIAGIAQVLLFLNSIQRWREGKDSVFGDWMKMLDSWSKPNANDPWWLKAIKELVQYMEKALGIADRLRINAGGAPGSAPAPKVGASAPLGDKDISVPAPFISGGKDNGQAGTWLYGYRQARAAGVGVIGAATTRNAEFAEAPQPSLPPGGGVMRGGVQQTIQNHFVIQGDNRTAQDIADEVTNRLDDIHDSAAAALR